MIGTEPLPELSKDERLYAMLILRLIKAKKITSMQAELYNRSKNGPQLKLTFNRSSSVVCKE